MQDLRQLQLDLINYLVSKTKGVENYITDGGPIDKQTRLNIYSNAYKQRLRGVIDTDHELLSFYLGDDLFDKLVNGYIDTHPSKHTSLRDFCSEVPNYLKNTAPFNEHPILAELARFEQTLLFAFDANDSDNAELLELNNLNAEDWPNLKIRFHPSVQLFETSHNCVETWQALKKQASPPEPIQLNYCAWIVWRNQQRITEFRSLEASELACINTFLRGGSLAEACEQLLQFHHENEVSKIAVTYLTQWLTSSQISYLITD